MRHNGRSMKNAPIKKNTPTTAEFLRSAISLSETDRAIVSLLQSDGRMPFKQIANHVGLSEKTVSSRVKDLVDESKIQITAVTDPKNLGFNAIALLGIVADPSVAISSIVEELAKIDAVDYVVVSTGRFSLFVELLCGDYSELMSTLESKIGKVTGLKSFEIFNYLSLHYQNAYFASASQKGEFDKGIRPQPMDEIDIAIVSLLSEDGRRPFLQIADQLSVSESLIRMRYKNLLDKRMISVIALINPMALDYKCLAWVAIKVAMGYRVKAVADKLASLSNTTYVAICAGRFDIFTELVCTSPAQLLDVYDQTIRAWEEVSEIEVSVYMDLFYKRVVPKAKR